MKKLRIAMGVIVSLLCLLVLAVVALPKEQEELQPTCDDELYREPYFEEVWDLDSNINIFEVAVDCVLEGTYHLDRWSEVEYIVMEATVSEVLHQRDASADLTQGNAVLRWTDISACPDSTAALQEIFASADSLMICGTDAGRWNSTISGEERVRWDEDYSGVTDWEETERGFVPRNLPQCIYFDINNWGALPMIGGHFDTQRIIDALALSDYGENFSLAEKDPDHGLFFCSDNNAEDVRSGLRRYIREF